MAETKAEPKDTKAEAQAPAAAPASTPAGAPNKVAVSVISARLARVQESGLYTPKMQAQFDRMTAKVMKGNN